jgi:nitroreductase
MEAIECVKTRISVRKFKSDPVPKETLVEIVEAAQRSPSYRNCQPWEVVIVSGKKKEALSSRLVHLTEKGVGFKPDIPSPGLWPDTMRKRMDELLKKRAAVLNIKMDDPQFMQNSLIANFRFYGAPHAIFLYQDSSLSTWQILDMGIFAQSLMLAAHAKGLGTVPQAYLTNYSEEVKNFLEIPEYKRLVLGISIGYPDPKDKASTFRSDRVELKSILRWIE